MVIVKFCFLFIKYLGVKIAENGDGEIVAPSWCVSGSCAPCGARIS